MIATFPLPSASSMRLAPRQWSVSISLQRAIQTGPHETNVPIPGETDLPIEPDRYIRSLVSYADVTAFHRTV